MSAPGGLEDTPQLLDELIQKCFKAKEKAYNPYSKFRVGAALLTEGGQIFTGCNVENASYGLCICAERTAICKAVSEGYRSFKAIAVSSDMTEKFISPCGNCRQFMIEFGGDYEVFLTKGDGSYQRHLVRDLLPHSFESGDLIEFQQKQQ
ncbi:cytidine deaminase-like [Dysidea avara]|uniref:cytidine deaminase-like n=1 Tax=Dysidea avara TaxID=196820 RepID=UPI00331B70FF